MPFQRRRRSQLRRAAGYRWRPHHRRRGHSGCPPQPGPHPLSPLLRRRNERACPGRVHRRLTLLGSDPSAVADAQRRLSRIGINRPGGADLERALEALPAGDYPVVDYRTLAAIPVADRTFRVLDVRRRDEYRDGHLDEAVNAPLHELLEHLHHVPAGPLWVHCASGARASIAVSLLARAGFDVTLVDGGPDDD